MVNFTTTILQFDQHGDKTGWTYIHVPADIAKKLQPGVKRSIQVKGKLDAFRFKQLNLIPMGEGNFILTLNAAIRKAIHKGKGATVNLIMEIDHTPFTVPSWIMECLQDEPEALDYFNALTPSHQKYFIKWIESAKTGPTRVKRLAQTVTALLQRMDFGEMIRANKRSH